MPASTSKNYLYKPFVYVETGVSFFLVWPQSRVCFIFFIFQTKPKHFNVKFTFIPIIFYYFFYENNDMGSDMKSSLKLTWKDSKEAFSKKIDIKKVIKK